MSQRPDNYPALTQALAGDHKALGNAFYWKSTPQGHTYWADRWRGHVPLSEEDYAFLTRMANEERARL